MNWQWVKIITKRFVKVFFFGGIGAMVAVLAINPLADITQWRPWLAILATAFLSGGLGAIEKWGQGYRPQ